MPDEHGICDYCGATDVDLTYIYDDADVPILARCVTACRLLLENDRLIDGYEL